MPDIYLTRHGQTVWNTEIRMQGRQNSPLTPEGITGAEKLGEALQGIPFSRCFTSPLPRAIHTSSLLLRGREVPLTISKHLAEMDLGDWEGLSISQASERFPETFYHFRHRPDLYYPTGEGETFYNVLSRAHIFLEEMKNLSPNSEPVLVVTHGILLQAIMLICEDRQMPTLRTGQVVDQTTKFRIRWDGHKWLVIEKNISA
jgi:probable phosphoglycerate mutase